MSEEGSAGDLSRGSRGASCSSSFDKSLLKRSMTWEGCYFFDGSSKHSETDNDLTETMPAD